MIDNHDDDECECDVCTNKQTFEGLENDIRETVAGGGFKIIGVLGDNDSMPFAYTVGLSRLSRPEMLVFGPTVPVCASILEHLNRVIKLSRDGRAFANGEVYNPDAEENPGNGAKIVNTGPQARDLAGWLSILGEESIPIQQVLLADGKGVFPDEPGCEFPFSMQPVLKAVLQ